MKVTEADAAGDSADLVLIKALYASFASQDPERIISHFSDDVILREAQGLPYGGVYRGRSGVLELLGKLAQCWQDLAAVDFEFLLGTNTVAAVIQIEGIARNSGQTLSQKVVEVWRIRGDKIVEGTIFYFDTHAIRRICAL